MSTLSEFEEMLKTHDWFFDYSDDHRAWEKGRKEAFAIRVARTNLETEGFGVDADALFEKYNQR
jgi:hypothetical protein